MTEAERLAPNDVHAVCLARRGFIAAVPAAPALRLPYSFAAT